MPALRDILLAIALVLALFAACVQDTPAADWAAVGAEPARRVIDIEQQHRDARAGDATGAPDPWEWVYRCHGRVCLSRTMACDRTGRAPCKAAE